jgi:DNA-binding transcriptional LysR family regulator
MSDPGFDLALLPTLDALLRERSVTRAARVLGRSQPAISRELAALRVQFGDLLLVRTKAGMALTPRAQELHVQVGRVLGDARTLLAPARFEPAQAACDFRVSMNDYEAAVLLPIVSRQLLCEAPHVRLAVVQRRRKEAEDALASDEVQLAIGRFVGVNPLLHHTDLFEDEFYVFGSRQNSALRELKTLDGLLANKFVIVSPGNEGDFHGLFDGTLNDLGRRRRVAFSAPNFLLLPPLLSSGDLVALAPRALGPTLMTHGITGVRPPVLTPRFTVSMIWHQRRHRDAASAWLRSLFINAARSIIGQTRPSRRRTAAPAARRERLSLPGTARHGPSIGAEGDNCRNNSAAQRQAHQEK